MEDYTEFTEVTGSYISKDQLYRMKQRYTWAASLIDSTDKCLELCCGSGQGINLLQAKAASLTAVDITESLTSQAQLVASPQTVIITSEAISFLENCKNSSFNKIVLFEAIYYIEDLSKLLNLIYDKLSEGGSLLLSSPNPLLSTFNRSHHSFFYPSSRESFGSLQCKFDSEKIIIYGVSFSSSSITAKVLRGIKRFAVRFNLIPRTMTAKRILKRIFTGKLVEMPASLSLDTASLLELRSMSSESEILIEKPEVLFFRLVK